MKILVVAPTHDEFNLMKWAKEHLGTKHDIKIIETGIGKVASASEVAVELQSMYDLVAVIGFAGGSDKFKQGDIVIPSYARYSDVVLPDEIVSSLTDVYDLEGNDEVTILTGDQFVSATRQDRLQTRFGLDIIFDMEATAIAQVCSEYGTEVLVMKVVSDIPSDENPTGFTDFVLKCIEDSKSTDSDILQEHPFVKFMSYLNMN